MTEIRDHRTDSINRARIQLELNRAARSGVFVAVALVLGLIVALWVARNIGSTIGQSSQSVSFYVDTANDVVAQSDEVRFLGIPDGRVSNVTMKGNQAVVTGTFATKYGKIYRNATAVIRPNTALEDMYVDITNPGTPSAGLATAAHPLPASATDTSVNLDDVLDTFNADARDSIRTLLNNLGNGLADRGAALKEAFVELAPTLAAAGQLSDQLAGRAQLVRQLVHNTSTLMGDLSRRQADLRTLIANGSAALTTIQSKGTDVNTILEQLPGTLTDLKSSLASVSGVVGHVDTAVQRLDPVADELPTALSAVRSLTRDASPAVRALQKPVQKLVPTVETLSPLSANVESTVSWLTPQVPAFNHLVTELVACRTGVQGFFEWNPSLAKFGDDRGFSPRGNLVVGLQSDGVTNSPFETEEVSCTGNQASGGGVLTAAEEH
jgi:phospholipid/cholesterol/gamma-HCH transport system substrate-binding protein